MPLPRLRQVVLAARHLEPLAGDLEATLGVQSPFRDPGVGHFGLENAVYALGDTFVEIVSPLRPDTAAGRHIDRRGGDCGYMVMFEVADEAAVRDRLDDLQVRIVWDTTHDDIVDLHLHPSDVGAAIVALDITEPPGSWRWGGPGWVGTVPRHGPGGLTGITVAAEDPEATARRWATVLGVEPADATTVLLDAGRQRISVVAATDTTAQGIVRVSAEAPESGSVTLGGVTFDRTRISADAGHDRISP